MGDYILRRSSRAKRIKLVVKETGVELVLPSFVPEIIGRSFASFHKDWIKKHSKKQRNSLPIIPSEDGATIFFMGKAKFRLEIKENQKRNTYEIKSDRLIVNMKLKKSKKEVLKIIEKFYRDEAKKYLTKRTKFFAEKLGVSFGRITIRNQRTRWGSCSSKGNLNYNWKIMKENPEIIDYLVIHELCHRIEMNHSSRFWRLVKKLDPNYKIHRNKLKNEKS